MLIIENVGDLVFTPAASTSAPTPTSSSPAFPEGDDKPYKYPNIYRGLEVLIINKTDLLPYVPFKMDYFPAGC